ncbi:hypothetical protein [Bacillus sp. ISL-55]|uniref:hypothetical protein n=1 Tax=Bacillus sp. ISL-55 TaxID=2819134 RepID=UPI001BEA5964|nr:hypothetical protein [Bacillus sp. ISL-55]
MLKIYKIQIKKYDKYHTKQLSREKLSKLLNYWRRAGKNLGDIQLKSPYRNILATAGFLAVANFFDMR